MTSRLRNLWEATQNVLTVGAAVAAIASVVLLYRARAGVVERTAGVVERQLDDWSSEDAIGHRIGPESAAVVITEFGDYECPACRALHPQVQRLLAQFPDEVALVYRHWPLEYHRSAYPAALAAVCADRQGMFPEMHTYLYSRSDWIAGADANLMEVARRVGVSDTVAFRSCLKARATADVVERDIARAREIGGGGTPTFVVGDRLVAQLPDSAAVSAMLESPRPER